MIERQDGESDEDFLFRIRLKMARDILAERRRCATMVVFNGEDEASKAIANEYGDSPDEVACRLIARGLARWAPLPGSTETETWTRSPEMSENVDSQLRCLYGQRH